MQSAMKAKGHYTRTAVALHWLIAALIILSALFMGWTMTEHGGLSPGKPEDLVNYHKWVGVTVLALALLRIVWRLTHRVPPDMEPMAALAEICSAMLVTDCSIC